MYYFVLQQLHYDSLVKQSLVKLCQQQPGTKCGTWELYNPAYNPLMAKVTRVASIKTFSSLR